MKLLVGCFSWNLLNVILGSLMLVFGAVMVIKGAVIVPAKALK